MGGVTAEVLLAARAPCISRVCILCFLLPAAGRGLPFSPLLLLTASTPCHALNIIRRALLLSRLAYRVVHFRLNADVLQRGQIPLAPAYAWIDNAVLLIHEHQVRVEPDQFILGYRRAAHDDNLVTREAQASRCAIESNNTRPRLTGDSIGLETRSGRDVHHMEPLVRSNVSCLHKGAVNSEAPHIVQVGLCHPGPMNLRFAYRSHHNELFSSILYIIRVNYTRYGMRERSGLTNDPEAYEG